MVNGYKMTDQELFFDHWLIYTPGINTYILNGKYNDFMVAFNETFVSKEKE